MAVQRFARPDRFVQARPNPDSFPFFLRTATLPLPLPRCPRAPSIFNQKITHANTKRAILHPSNIHSFGSAGSVFPSHTHTVLARYLSALHDPRRPPRPPRLGLHQLPVRHVVLVRPPRRLLERVARAHVASDDAGPRYGGVAADEPEAITARVSQSAVRVDYWSIHMHTRTQRTHAPALIEELLELAPRVHRQAQVVSLHQHDARLPRELWRFFGFKIEDQCVAACGAVSHSQPQSNQALELPTLPTESKLYLDVILDRIANVVVERRETPCPRRPRLGQVLWLTTE